MRGKPLGFGIETQALEAAAGLNSASGRMRRCVGEAMLVGRATNLLVCWIHADEGGNSEFVDVVEGQISFLVGVLVLIRLVEIACTDPCLYLERGTTRRRPCIFFFRLQSTTVLLMREGPLW